MPTAASHARSDWPPTASLPIGSRHALAYAEIATWLMSGAASAADMSKATEKSEASVTMSRRS